MWISKEEYNQLTQNSELGAKIAMKLAEVLTELNETQFELIKTKQELEGAKTAYGSEADEWFYQYTIAKENHRRAKERNEELARDLAQAEVDLALYKKVFDDIAHAFGDEFKYLNTRIAFSESEIDRNELSRAVWATSCLWFDVHDIMKDAGWRIEDEQDSKN